MGNIYCLKGDFVSKFVATTAKDWSSKVDDLSDFLFGSVMIGSSYVTEKRVVVVEGYCYPA